MTEPRVPGTDDTLLELPCGETIDAAQDLDMGMRDFACPCGQTHAVVMDIHPLTRFIPTAIVDVLRETTEAADGDPVGEFGTHHLLGMVREEVPAEVASADLSETGATGYTTVWVAEMPSRALHEMVVELVVELMEHAVSHGSDEGAAAEFEAQMREFDVEEFVATYRAQRDFDDEHDTAV
ncbi:MAG: DUF5815 family protein [Halobacteriaceae archaeon]